MDLQDAGATARYLIRDRDSKRPPSRSRRRMSRRLSRSGSAIGSRLRGTVGAAGVPCPASGRVGTRRTSTVFPLSLGRRSCPPTGPVSLGLRPDAGLQEVLADVPWQASTHRRCQVRTPQVLLDATVEDPAGDLLVDDVPDTCRTAARHRPRHTA
jgi:hypothetical protein